MDRDVGEQVADEPAATLHLLDGFTLRRAGLVVPVLPACQRLLALLALHDRPVLRCSVAESLWPDSTPEHAAACLRTALWRLPSPTLVTATPASLRLGDVVVDLRECEALAWQLLGRGDAPRLPSGILAWVEQLSAELLPGWSDDWVEPAREQFLSLRLHALEALSAALATQRRFMEALVAGLRAVAIDPLRESAHRRVIETYLDEGNVGEALKQYRKCERLLRVELGVVPSPELRAAVAPLLRRPTTSAV